MDNIRLLVKDRLNNSRRLTLHDDVLQEPLPEHRLLGIQEELAGFIMTQVIHEKGAHHYVV